MTERAAASYQAAASSQAAVGSARELRVEELRAASSIQEMGFENTSQVPPLQRTIGQDRAMRALEVGLGIDAPGFNIFISGRSGTGRTSIVRTLVEKVAAGKPVPPDWIYLYNFTNPDRPRAFSLPPGQGVFFAGAVEGLVNASAVELRKLFESPLYLEQRRRLDTEAGRRKQTLIAQLEKDVLAHSFTLEFTPQGILTIPTSAQGKKLSPKEFDELPEETRASYTSQSEGVQEMLQASMLEAHKVDREMADRVGQVEREMAVSLLSPLFLKMRESPQQCSRAGAPPFEPLWGWLQEMKEDLVAHLYDWREKEGEPIPKAAEISRYRVNVFIDRTRQVGAPLILEMNPSYYNLTGKIEFRPAFGTYITDQTMIKAGAMVQANGGYLVLPAQELLASPFAWEALKRSLRQEQLRVENLSEFAGGVPTVTLRPEPIPLDLTVILIGQPEHYSILYSLDEDFRKLFKIRADFDLEMPRNQETIADYASFLHDLAVTAEDSLWQDGPPSGSAAALEHCCGSKGRAQTRSMPFHAGAVAALVDYGSRLAESQRKLSARFAEISDVAFESYYWARRAGKDQVQAEHVSRALEEKAFRSRQVEDKIQESIDQGTLMITLEGGKVGQINGLSVYASGGYSFGRPSRITARTYLGEEGILHIERETELSGPIHSKGVLTLAGYLGGQYAQEFPLSFSASITFEQLYEGVEGDSASSAELYALLSSLAEVPLRQDVAVTGSVNQYGEIQPIGGVNEKVEGFFAVCKAKGLTGRQGVMIPPGNVQNLMLRDEVVEAVRGGFFHVWVVRTVDEGIEHLTGLPAGERLAEGGFTPGSAHELVYRRLGRFAERMKEYDAG
ncbi:MAG: ATP-binding protein [Coprothermobacterota bacterium]|nr:ATP-binding protein [Coprothermobacterota bacterium]